MRFERQPGFLRATKISILLFAILIGLALSWFWYYNRTHDVRSRDQQADQAVEKFGTYQGTRQFTLGITTWVGYAPFYLAQEKELYPDGLTVRIIRIEDTGEKRAALLSKRVDGLGETVDIFTNAPYPGAPGRIVYGLDESDGADGIVAQPPITAIGQLKGKKIATEPGMPPYFLLLYLLNAEGMTADDVTIQKMNSADAGLAFIGGRVDAAGTFEPYLTQARKRGNLLATSADTPGLIVDILVVRDELLNSRRDDLLSLLVGWERALQYHRDYPDEAEAIMSSAFGQTTQEFREMLSGLHFYNLADNQEYFGVGSNQGRVFEVFESAAQMWVRNGLIKRAALAHDKIDPSIVRDLEGLSE